MQVVGRPEKGNQKQKLLWLLLGLAVVVERLARERRSEEAEPIEFVDTMPLKAAGVSVQG